MPGARLANVKSMHRVDAFGNSLGVCRKLAEGIERLPGWPNGISPEVRLEIRRKNREARWEREGRSLKRRPEDLPQDCRRLLEYAGNNTFGGLYYEKILCENCKKKKWGKGESLRKSSLPCKL
ncbi:hypothetical protein BHM03_00022299, partial [Ensete ventricosum]